MLMTDVVLRENGHAQERSLLAQVLQDVREDQLWIEDRNFCTLGLMCGMARRGAVRRPSARPVAGRVPRTSDATGCEPPWPGL